MSNVTFNFILMMFLSCYQYETIEIEKTDLVRCNLIYDVLNTSSNCKILEFKIVEISDNGGDIIEKKYSSDIIQDSIYHKSIFSELDKGDVIWIKDIESVSDCILNQRAGYETFKILIL